MSGEYMRQIMESIQIAQDLTEGYEQRVQSVVDALKQDHPEGITKKGFEQKVQQANDGHGLNVTELRGKSQPGLNQGNVGNSRRDFLKDVAAKIEFKRDTSKVTAKKERIENALLELETIIQDAVGTSFPDGDPFDTIYPKARKLGIGIDAMIDWLDRAAKRLGPYKGYHDYVESTWDDYLDSKLDSMDDSSPRDNPWRG